MQFYEFKLDLPLILFELFQNRRSSLNEVEFIAKNKYAVQSWFTTQGVMCYSACKPECHEQDSKYFLFTNYLLTNTQISARVFTIVVITVTISAAIETHELKESKRYVRSCWSYSPQR